MGYIYSLLYLDVWTIRSFFRDPNYYDHVTKLVVVGYDNIIDLPWTLRVYNILYDYFIVNVIIFMYFAGCLIFLWPFCRSRPDPFVN